MFDPTLLALIVFGVLLAICLYGLWIASARSSRLNATSRNLDDRAYGPRETTTAAFDTARP